MAEQFSLIIIMLLAETGEGKKKNVYWPQRDRDGILCEQTLYLNLV